MDKSKLAMVVVFLSTFVTSGGQIFLKMAAMKLSFDVVALLTNYPLYMGCFLYGVGAIMLIVSLKYGDLSVLYPIYALNFIWVSILSPMFFNDVMSDLKWAGVFLVIMGVTVVNLGSRGARK
ncbi:MAG: hypothetical protein NTU61_01410 [Candidatus Altiarchaeota archaeon]|nr:hypothetical protein [Candidatus Altiarchaeota archaeon]